MNMNNYKKSISYEEAMQMPEYAHLHDTLRYLNGKKPNEIFPKHHERSMEYITEREIYATFKDNPNLSLNNAVSIVLKQLPEDISAPLLLKLTSFIIEKWEKLSAKFHPEVQQTPVQG